MNPSRSALFIVGVIAASVGIVVSSQQDARSLAHPSSSGRNLAMTATTTFHRIPAFGNSCSVMIVNTNSEVLCTGYAKARAGDGGPYGLGFTMIEDGGVNCTNSLDVCNSTAAGCISNNVIRDTVPDAIWYATKTLGADGGTAVRFELSSGCETP